MSRHVYQLQSESIKVLKDHVANIADEMDVSDRYIYSILQGRETDIFAKFLELYRACVRAGAPVRYWDERLAEVREQDQPFEFSIRTEAKRFIKESADVPNAVIDGDIHAILREAREAIASGKRLERAALGRIEQERTATAEALRSEAKNTIQFRSTKVAVNGRAK